MSGYDNNDYSASSTGNTTTGYGSGTGVRDTYGSDDTTTANFDSGSGGLNRSGAGLSSGE